MELALYAIAIVGFFADGSFALVADNLIANPHNVEEVSAHFDRMKKEFKDRTGAVKVELSFQRIYGDRISKVADSLRE